MTSRQIEWRLVFEHYARATVMPRFTPLKWFECDVCELTYAGYFVEYEIKMTRQDFKVDAQKVESLSYRERRSGVVPLAKHQRLAAGDVRGPVRFYFVTPKGLLTEGEIPTWAGWLEAREARSCFAGCMIDERKPAPRLHGEKTGEDLAKRMHEAAYWRFHRRRGLTRPQVDLEWTI